jgi:L-ornithine N5-oxygenase
MDDDGQIVLTLTDRVDGRTKELPTDVLMLGTGFESDAPELVRGLADQMGIDDIEVGRAYRMKTPPSVTAGCYLQGMNEASHGIADSLLSVLAIRAADIVNDVLAHRTAMQLPTAVNGR